MGGRRVTVHSAGTGGDDGGGRDYWWSVIKSFNLFSGVI